MMTEHKQGNILLTTIVIQCIIENVFLSKKKIGINIAFSILFRPTVDGGHFDDGRSRQPLVGAALGPKGGPASIRRGMIKLWSHNKIEI